ncbi:Selenide, water dikinase [Sporomusa sphaeroides DSM 2875]|uniref:Selenide, water dikinase n=2 Tax=Sporomusa TaxID=2375 RepID=A0ABM9W2P2_9FIRM|nr:selenide, water dikinase [Sporomusa sphaeroides DSM 2875]CVK18549.1 Selenide, water dikinase [Sporomusa sphaeroides DSM 2875]SCM82291.1 Selenide, water dikinase [uncultured Sporomusa sp.]
MGPGDLAGILNQLPVMTNPNVLVGITTSDDAGVYKLNETTALVQTVDFFTPIVDDPYLFGQIAAANSLSDIYAMGATPLTALNLVAFPNCKLPGEALLAILQGGQDKVAEAGAVIIGGHTIDDTEPKYGLAVTGITHPDRIWTNAGAQPGDCLILTKALGTGILASAARADLFLQGVAAATASMAALNATAAKIAAGFSVHACTDITGFGLIGHVYEMAAGSKVTIRLDSTALPLLPEAAEAAAMGFVPGGAYQNRNYLTAATFAENVPEPIRDICFDPQTSGGLLLAVPASEAGPLVAALKAAGLVPASIIGEVTGIGEGEVHVR